jgi:hypothetical protein
MSSAVEIHVSPNPRQSGAVEYQWVRLRFMLWYKELGRAIAKVPSHGFGQITSTLVASPAF